MRKVIMAMAMGACAIGFVQAQYVYPDARRCNQVDTYFNTQVADPYRWMEDDMSQDVADWVEAENQLTRSVLDQSPYREQLKQRMTELNNYEKTGSPILRHGYYYYWHNNGLQNQYVLFRQKTLGGESQLVLDPNTLSTDGTVSLKSYTFSHNGRYMAYSISRSGSDWEEIYVLDLKSMTLTSDHIKWAKFGTPQWYKNGFFYSAYDAPQEGREISEKNSCQKIYYHQLGANQESDRLVYYRPEYPLRFYTPAVDDDERYLFIYEAVMSQGNNLYMMPLSEMKKETPQATPLVIDPDHSYSVADIEGNYAYIETNWEAKNLRIMKVDLRQPAREHWTEFIPEGRSVMNGAQVLNHYWIIQYLQDACDHAYVYNREGKLLHEVKLPALGSVSFSGTKEGKEVYYSFRTFNMASTIYKYDVSANRSELYHASAIRFDGSDYEVEQKFYTSKDGTRVPMFIVHKKGLQMDGNNPTLLYGYGGFNISLNPWFAQNQAPLLELGVVYAVVNLRGGGEFGEDWHLAGTKMQKQNVFDDFIAAAEFLIQEGYTRPEKLCIEGGSNGGLLVGAVTNQRPDLFRVALPAVGVMDMMRYHRFTIGWNWASDYGTSDDSPEMAAYLSAYSPAHNVREGVHYPAILVTTADHDDRVVPAHSFKYAAALQHAQIGDEPHLIRIDTKAGHGSGKPLSKVIDEAADKYGFMLWMMDKE